MAKITNIKSPVATTAKVATPVVTAPAASSISVTAGNSSASNAGTLTVVVLDAKSQPVAGASVSITPSDASATTNASGEAQFKLGSATKYEVTASTGNSTVTVPYYVTANGATRIIVNPIYVKSVEAQRHHSSGLGSGFLATGGIILVIIIVLVVVWKMFRRRSKISICHPATCFELVENKAIQLNRVSGPGSRIIPVN